MCSPFVRTHLVKGSFKTIVVLPKYVDLNEWLASNVFEFFNYLNQFYGTVTEFCTAQRCPIMNGGPGHDYTWMDNQRKQVKLPAPTYIDYTMTWMNNLISDETVFPTKAGGYRQGFFVTRLIIGRDFPPNFIYTVRHLVRQMMRIFCHVYYHHFEQIVHLCLEGHYNSLFAHFISFAKEFDLLEQKDVEPLMGLIEILEQNGNIS